MDDLPVLLDGTKCVCKLCKSTSTDTLALPGGHGAERYGGRLPWAKYKRVVSEGEVLGKQPVAKLCLVCVNVYNALGREGEASHHPCVALAGRGDVGRKLRVALAAGVGAVRFCCCCCCCCCWFARDQYSTGLQARFNTMGDYYKFISAPGNAKEHPRFLASRREWLRQHASDPDKARISSKKALAEVQTTLDVVKAQGVRFERNRRLIPVDSWDEEEHGPLDPAKVVEEVVFGEHVKGIYIVDKKAGFKVVEYDQGGMEERTREHTGEGPFAQQALEAKRGAVLAGQAEASKARRAAAVEVQGISARGILDMIKGSLKKEETAASDLGDGSAGEGEHLDSNENLDASYKQRVACSRD
jgi:hypothetical protein